MTPEDPATAPFAPETRLFVYYRVRPADLPALDVAVRAAQRRLADVLPGLDHGWLRRPGIDPAGAVTVMETYARPGIGLTGADRTRIEAELALALADVVPGGVSRHVEVFMPMASDGSPCA